MQHVLIIGATSAIAEACARLFAARGDALTLAARDQTRLPAIAEDLRVRGAADVEVLCFDASDPTAPATLVDAAFGGQVDVVLVAHGSLPDQAACQSDQQLLRRELEVNGTSVIVLANLVGERLLAQGSGTLAVIGSVAGDRGRQGNYAYGAAKAAVDAFLSGLRQRLTPHGINVLTIKPGFVDTPMTASFNKGALWATPSRVARGIVRAIDRRKGVAYLPWFWWPVMQVIRHIPEPVFRKLKL